MDQLDMQVALAKRDIRRHTWMIKRKSKLTTMTIEEYLLRCEETDFEVRWPQ
jgi:hypothetical protein